MNHGAFKLKYARIIHYRSMTTTLESLTWTGKDKEDYLRTGVQLCSSSHVDSTESQCITRSEPSEVAGRIIGIALGISIPAYFYLLYKRLVEM